MEQTVASGMPWNGTGYLEMCVIATSQRGFFFFLTIDSSFFFFMIALHFLLACMGDISEGINK